MAQECAQKHINPKGIDGLNNQLDVIEWLIDNKKLFRDNNQEENYEPVI